MSKARVIALSVVHGGLTKAEAATRFGVSWRWVHTLVARYEAGGEAALEPRSRRPRTNARATPAAIRERILQLREQLESSGFDHGPATIATHLERTGLRAPSTSTIRRILHTAGRIVPQPKKRPKSSLHRFQAAQPNETWQSDFTHWRLADGTDVEILNWLDDHSRYLLACTAHPRVTGKHVIEEFLTVADEHGAPASTLTDNGSVYTSRFTGGRNGFEYLLAALSITQKNGAPSHPQTQGKIERFHQTLKRWLAKQSAARDLIGLQQQLDTFRDEYNKHRPHRALGNATPHDTYRATIKAQPRDRHDPHWRVRIDQIDRFGKLTLRRAGRLHHLGVGTRHAHTRVLILVAEHDATVVAPTTGEILSHHRIEPERNYWRNQNRSPGRWPGLPI